MNDNMKRTATVDLSEHREGFFVVTASGDAGEFHACSRSAHVATGLATYAAMFGEAPVREWECGDEPPFSCHWLRNDAIAAYLANEAEWTTYLRSNR